MEEQQPEPVPNLIHRKPFPVPGSLKARYQDGKGVPRNIRVQSMSRGGICIEDTSCLSVGTCLQLLLNVKGKMIKAQGEVTWNSKAEWSFLHGIRFTFMKQGDREWFNTFIMDWAAEQIARELDFSGLTEVPAGSDAERRSFARLRIPLRVDVGFNEDTLLIQTHIYDLSEGGLCLISNFEIKKDQKLYLKLWLTDKHFVLLMGIVKYYVKKVHENRVVNFHGVEFTKVDASAAEMVTQFLNQKRSELAAIEITLDDIIAQSGFPELP